MASKWRSQQRRQRWEQSSLLLPPRLLRALEQPQSQLGAFGHQLFTWAGLPSTFAQVSEAKHVAQSLVALINPPAPAAVDPASSLSAEALHVYVEVLFQQNSKPVHRTFLTALSQFPLGFGDSVMDAFKHCCRDYGRKGVKETRFALIAVAMSLVNFPKAGLLRGVMKQCSRIIALSLSYDLKYVLQQAQKGESPTPAIMEECQDAMATLYYLLQHFPEMFTTSIFATSEVSDPLSVEDEAVQFHSAFFPKEISKTGVLGAVVNIILDVLQSSSMSRDCVVAAGVCLCTASLLQSSPLDLALILANHIFYSQNLQLAAITEHGVVVEPSAPGLLEKVIASDRDSSLQAEMGKMTDFGKLCVTRGLLTGIPRPILNITLVSGALKDLASDRDEDAETTIKDSSFKVLTDKSCCVWTLLYDGILPAICSCCEASVDSHFKFHSITALQICLQQIKASMVGHLTNTALKEIQRIATMHGLSLQLYEVFPEAIRKRVLKLIWNNWEDPLAQTVKQIQAVFDLLADVQALIPQRDESNALDGCSEKARKELAKAFLGQIAADLLSVGGHRKGRYVPLASLALRLGARTLLDMQPDLLFQTVYALADDDVCCSASSFLRTFLERLREEYWSSDGVVEGYSKFRSRWIPAIIAGMFYGNPRLRCNMNAYALPVAFQIDGDSLLPILAFLLDGYISQPNFDFDEIKSSVGMPNEVTTNQRISALVPVLKVARSLFLIDGEIAAYVQEGQNDLIDCQNKSHPTLDAAVSIKGQVIRIPIFLLELALTHMEDGLRIDAAELLGLNPKGASMPSGLELHLLKYSIPLNMRCSSTAFRMKWTNMLKKFFKRVRTAVERQIKTEGFNLRMNGAQSSASVMDSVKTSEEYKSNKLTELRDNASKRLTVTVEGMQDFMQWLSQFLVCSLYPSAPYERKNMAMELFNALLDVWSLSEFSPVSSHHAFTPYHPSVLSAESVLVLVCAIVDSWDRLRENAFSILDHYPTPFPGIDTDYTVQRLVKWAKGLVGSPRVRESDAGALALRLVFRKYVCELTWMVQVHESAGGVIVQTSQLVEENDKRLAGEAVCLYINSLNDWLEAGIQDGERDLLGACKNSFVHGVLLTLRYMMEEIDWMSEAVRAGVHQLQLALKRLIGLLLRVTSLTLGVVSANALNIQEHMSRHTKLPDSQIIIEDVELDIFEDEEGMGYQLDSKLEMMAPAEQMMMVGCWLSMKEVSLLLGTITKRLPLAGCAVAAESPHELLVTPKTQDAVGAEETHQLSYLLDAEQLEMIGEHFLHVLFSMKHNGAVDKTRAGFSVLCNRLLHVPDSRHVDLGAIVAIAEVFDRLPKRDIVSWTSIISGYAKQRDGREALLLFEKMKQESVKPDEVAFVCVINACASLADLGQAIKIHTLAIEANFDKNMFVGAALVDMYGKCGNLVKAREVFDQMVQRDCVSWNAMVAGYAKHGCSGQALELFQQMKQEGFKPDSVTYICLLHAFANLGSLEQGKQVHAGIIEAGFHTDVYVGNAIMDMYVKCGSLLYARNLFDRMHIRSVVSWNTMMVGYLNGGNAEEAITLYQQMKRLNLKPDNVTFVCVLNACSHLGLIEYGRETHADVIISQLELRLFVAAALIDMYLKYGNLPQACQVFDKSANRDLVCWSVMIAGHVKEGNALEALSLYHKMKREGVRSDGMTVVCILNACAKLELLEEGQQVHLDIIGAGMYARAGQWGSRAKLRRAMGRRGVTQ